MDTGTVANTARYGTYFLCTLRYSSTILFVGYGDDELGFYTVYNEVFNTLAKEDMDHMDEQESDFEVMQLLETGISDTEPFGMVPMDSEICKSICRSSYRSVYEISYLRSPTKILNFV
jgi:hypothetical protein